MIMNAYFPTLYDLLGVFLALIAVNCIILGRAEMFARKNSVIDSFIDGAGMGIGFLLALAALAAIREVFGAGTLTVIPDSPIKIPILYKYNLPILTTAPGGFLVFGMLIALVNKIGNKNGAKKATRPPCAACPSANLCGKMPYDNDAAEIREEKI
jgi:electron transport complex protein RnfE